MSKKFLLSTTDVPVEDSFVKLVPELDLPARFRTDCDLKASETKITLDFGTGTGAKMMDAKQRAEEIKKLSEDDRAILALIRPGGNESESADDEHSGDDDDDPDADFTEHLPCTLTGLLHVELVICN